jgi:hypothetical protein
MLANRRIFLWFKYNEYKPTNIEIRQNPCKTDISLKIEVAA